METKSIFASKTFWGSVVAVVCLVLGLVGYDITAGIQADLTETIMAGVGVLGGLFAIYGRVRATKEIK